MRLLSLLATSFAITSVVHGLTSDLAAVDDFVSTSKDVAMYVYVPETKADKPAIVVAIHSCERDAQYYFDNTGYAALADQYGYIVIFPNSSAISGCWDTSSSASLSHNGGGDSQAIANMVSYAVTTYNADATRVGVTGSSSGGVMVNLLAGVYPEVFQAASVFSGYYVNSIWSYSGSRPKMMIWHGTIDDTYPYTDLGVELKGWSGVLDVSFTQNITDTPSPGYTKMVYGDGMKIIGISAAGVGHTVPVDAVTDLAWFCISPECDQDGVSQTSSSSSSTTSSSSITAAASSSSSTMSSSSATSTSSISSDSSTETSSTTREALSSSTGTTAVNAIASETATPVVIAAHSTLSSGAKIGIGIASVGGLLFLLAGAFLIRKRRQTYRSKRQNTIMSGEPEGHEMHPGYGVVPVHDSTPVGDNAEKYQGQKHLESMATTGLLAYTTGDHHRDSTASTLYAPHSPGGDQRYSTTSTTLLLPHSFREDQRQSTASTLILSHFPEGYEGQSAQNVPEQDVSEMLLNVDNEEMSETPLHADKSKNEADL